MSTPYESEFTIPNLLQGIQDEQSIPREDILAGLAAIDTAISSAGESFEINDDSTQLGEVAFRNDGQLIIASHKMVAPNGTLPNVPIAHVGSVVSYDLQRWEPKNRNNKDQQGWALYLPEQEQNGQLGRGQAWEQSAGRRRGIPFAVGQLIGNLEMAQYFGTVISQAEAQDLLEN